MNCLSRIPKGKVDLLHGDGPGKHEVVPYRHVGVERGDHLADEGHLHITGDLVHLTQLTLMSVEGLGFKRSVIA